MVNTTDQILLTLGARNNASSVLGQVDKDAKNMASSISSAISNINQGLMNIGSVTDNMMQGLTGKSAMDNIFGTSSKAETNKVLIGMMTDTEEAAESLFTTVDNVTNDSLTSMQDLIPAMNAFSSATGASDKDLESITDEMANFGAAVLAQTGSTDLAQQSMMDLSKGIKGAFASLDQYGVSEDALMRTGLWSGKEDDVKGYMAAVEKVIGSTDELMETNQGLDALIGKAFSRGGKKIGNEFLPVLKDIKKGFIELDNSLDGNLTASILAVSGGVEVMNQGLWNVSTTVNGVHDLADGFKFLTDKIKGVTEAAEGASDAINTVSNVSDIGAGAANVGGTVGKGEKSAEAGIGAMSAMDMLKGNNKEYEKLKKEIEKTTLERNKILEQINSPDTKNSMKMKKLQGDIDDKILNRWSVANDKNVQKLANLQLDKEKRYKDLQKKLSKSDLKISKDLEKVREFDMFKNRGKTQELSSESVSALFGLQENTLENLKKENWGLSDAIKDSFKNQKTKISDALTSGKEMLTAIPGKFKGTFKSAGTSITNSISSFSETLSNIKTDGIKGNFKNLDQKLLGIFKGTDELSDALSSVDDMTDISKTVTGAEDMAEGMKGIAGAGSTMAAAGPEMEAAAAGGAAVEAGATGLSATFTSLMVPLLAVSAAIIIMIPIVAFIAAEALIFIRLLADFMEALNFDSVDLDGAINGISQVATALAWVGVAMGAMSFTSIMTGLAVITGGFLGITGPLDLAVSAIQDVSKKLSQFNNLTINPSVATNLKTISDSLMAVSSAMGALTWTNITTGFSNWIAGALGFSSVTEGLDQAKNDIIQASQKLQEFSNMPVLDESVANNIQNVCDSLASVGDAMSALRSIRDGQNWDDMIGGLIGGIFGEGVDIQTALTNVKQDIVDASASLAQFTGLTEIPDGIGEKVKKVADTLKSVSEAFELLRGFRDNNIWDDMVSGIFGETDINTVLDKIITDINTASTKLASLKIDDSVNDDLIKNIQKVVSALTEVTNVANGLTSLPPMENFNTGNIDTVMSNVQKASDSLKGLTIGEVNEETITNIKNVASALTEVAGVMTSLTSLPPMDGFDSSTISTAVTNVQTAASELSKISGTTVGEDVNGVLGSIQTALQTLKDTLAAASGFSESSVNIGTQIVTGVQSGLSPLASTVTTQVSSATTASASAGWTGGAYIGQSINGGFKSSLDLHTTMTTEMGYVKTAVENGISEAKTVAQNGAAEIVQAFQAGIHVGSPGDIARTMKQEMIYTKDFILGAYGDLKKSAYGAGRLIVDSFGNPSLNMDYDNTLSKDNIQGLETLNSKVPTSQDNKTIIMYNTVTVDARNKTEKEATSILTLALEGMDHITNIDVDV